MSKAYELPLIQQSGDWHNWRLTGIGASEAPVIYLGDVYGKTPLTVWKNKTGYGEPIDNKRGGTDEDKARGNKLEDKARELFAEHTGIITEPVCMQSYAHPFMLASMDGMTADRKVGVEIKSPGEKVFSNILNYGIPDYYMPQVQHQIAVTGADEMYFYAYNERDYLAPREYIELIKPDYAMIEELIRREYEFWRHVEMGIAPGSEMNIQVAGLKVGLIMLAGYALAGKDEMGKIYQAALNVQRFSPSDPLRKIHAMVLGKSEEEIDKEKEKYRNGMVALGHGMRSYVPDVWLESVFNPKTGIYEAMEGKGAVFTSTRYVNEASYARRESKEIGVPCHVIYIERPGIGPANETEAKTLPLVKAISDVVLINDMDTTSVLGYRATEAACLAALSVVDLNQAVIQASNYEAIARASLRKVKNAGTRKTIRKATSRRRIK